MASVAPSNRREVIRYQFYLPYDSFILTPSLQPHHINFPFLFNIPPFHITGTYVTGLAVVDVASETNLVHVG